MTIFLSSSFKFLLLNLIITQHLKDDSVMHDWIKFDTVDVAGRANVRMTHTQEMPTGLGIHLYQFELSVEKAVL